jgi:hypothetical protein
MVLMEHSRAERRAWWGGLVFLLLLLSVGCVMTVGGQKVATPAPAQVKESDQWQIQTPGGDRKERPAEGL